MDPEELERLRQERLLNQQLMGNVGSSNISQTFAPTEPTTITTGFEGLLGQPEQLAQPSTPQVQADTTLLGMDASRANALADVLGTTAGVVGTGVAAKNLLDAFSGKSLASEMSNLDVVKRQKLINEFRAENIDPKTGRIKKGASVVGFDAPSTTKGQAARSIFGKGVSGALRFLTKGGVLGEAIAPTSLGDATISGAYDRRIAAGEDPAVVEADLYGPEGRPLSGPDAIMQNRSTAPTTFETPVIQSTLESAAPVTPTLPTSDTPDVSTGFEGTVPEVELTVDPNAAPAGITEFQSPSELQFASPDFEGDVGIARTRARLLEEFGAPTISQIQARDEARRLAQQDPGFRAASEERQASAMEPSTFMEAISDEERRGATGKLSQADLRDLAQAQAKGATPGDVQRGLEIQQRAGMGIFKPEQTELQEDALRKRIEVMDAQLAEAGITPSGPVQVDPVTGAITQMYSDGTMRFKGIGRGPSSSKSSQTDDAFTRIVGGAGGTETTEPGELTPEIVSSILTEAGGDKEKAREIAKQRGYSF